MITFQSHRVKGGDISFRAWVVAGWLLFSLLCGGAVRAQDPSGFLIERITVEGVRRPAAAEIIVSESLLREGQVYSATELNEAVYRVRRLFFVLNAEYSLRNGSTPGSYEVVITVDETRQVLFSPEVQARMLRYGGRDSTDLHHAGSVGFHHFVGSSGIAFANVRDDGDGGALLEAGYTRYGLFGRGGFASVSVVKDVEEILQDEEGDSNLATATVGIPLTGNHSLRSTLAGYEASFRGFRSEGWSVGLEWLYDTTDDPLFPTRGFASSAGVFYGETIDRENFYGFGPLRHEWSTLGWTLSARKHWALTPRQSWSLGLNARSAHYNNTASIGLQDYLQTELSVRHSVSLWDADKTRRLGDLRWESGLELSHRGYETSFPDERFITLKTGLALRNGWGVFRFNLAYQDYENVSGGF